MPKVLPLVINVQGKLLYFHSTVIIEDTIENITRNENGLPTGKKEFSFFPFYAQVLEVQNVYAFDNQSSPKFDVVDLVFGSASSTAKNFIDLPAGFPNLGQYRQNEPHVYFQHGFSMAKVHDASESFYVAGIQNFEEQPDTIVTARFAIIVALYSEYPTKPAKLQLKKNFQTRIIEEKITVSESSAKKFDFLFEKPFDMITINQFGIESMADAANLVCDKKTYLKLDLPQVGISNFLLPVYGNLKVLSQRVFQFPLPIFTYGQRIPITIINEEPAEVQFNLWMEVTCILDK
jgi:hypothetical protein